MEIRIIIAALVAMAVIGVVSYKALDFQAAFEEYWRSSAPAPAGKARVPQ